MTLSLRPIAALFAVCAFALAIAGCGGEDAKTAADVPSDAIALVGDTPIPRAEFDDLMERAEANYKAQKRPFPKVGSPEYQDLKTRAVAFLVQRYQFRAEAAELDVEATDEDVDKKLAEIQKASFDGSRDKLLAALKKEGLTEEDAREEIRDRTLQEKLYAKVTEDIEASEEEQEAYYEKNKQQFSQPASRDVRHILVKSKARADEVYRRLQDGGNFNQLARQYSTDTATKKIGGKLPVTKGQTVPPFDKVAFALEQGEVGEPVKTTFGWHVIKADSAIREEKVTPFEEVKKSIQDQLVQEKKDKAVKSWLEEMEKKYKEETVYAAGFEPPPTETGTTGIDSTGAATTTDG